MVQSKGSDALRGDQEKYHSFRFHASFVVSSPNFQWEVRGRMQKIIQDEKGYQKGGGDHKKGGWSGKCLIGKKLLCEK